MTPSDDSHFFDGKVGQTTATWRCSLCGYRIVCRTGVIGILGPGESARSLESGCLYARTKDGEALEDCRDRVLPRIPGCTADPLDRLSGSVLLT